LNYPLLGCFAIPHKHKLTGYKHPSSETNLRTLGGETSYKFFYENAIPALKKPSKLVRHWLLPTLPDHLSLSVLIDLILTPQESYAKLNRYTTTQMQNYRPKLEPYKESALCNRLPVTFNNEPMKGVRWIVCISIESDVARN
jgi:hypothetical protein